MKFSDSKENIPTIDRLHPAVATIKERFALTKPESTKHTFHVALDLSNAPIRFKVGDSIGIYAQNDPILVNHLIEAMKARADDQILHPRDNTPISLWNFLSFKANLSRLTSSFLKLFYEHEKIHDKKNSLHRLLQQENKALLTQFLALHDPLDVLKTYRDTVAPLQDLCAQFGPLLPRFYSVASSQQLYKTEVHLAVALFSFTHQGEQ